MKISKQLQKEMMKKKNSKYFILLFILFIAFSVYEVSINNSVVLPKSEAELVRCVDGDTVNFNIDGEEIKVRFLAIDTPEVAKGNTVAEPYGEEAKKFTCDLLTNASEIKLEYEESNKVDKYGRTLAWVWADGVLAQESLVRQGLAEVKYLYDDYKYTNIVQIGEKDAKQAKRGMWSE